MAEHFPWDAPPLSDEELARLADELFVDMDRCEGSGIADQGPGGAEDGPAR